MALLPSTSSLAPSLDSSLAAEPAAEPAAAPAAACAARFADRVVDSRFLELPAEFYTRLLPTPLPEPYWVAQSGAAGRLIGLDHADFDDPRLLSILAGNEPFRDAAPYAAVYSGHQFGVWAGQLGDGRAITLGEAVGPGGVGPDAAWEIQLKGSGRTPYSRMGDGRAVLRSSIREFLASEAMAGLGIPTTRALAIVGSALPVIRESVETAAVVTRLAPSFVRFGSFEHWFYSDRPDALRALADHVLETFYPEEAESPRPYAALLEAVVGRSAALVAAWQSVGFCHGVLNTDNMSILGLTLDYGPFGFLEAFDSGHVCNHSDETGRYAYGRQPRVVHWNLVALGQALVPLIGSLEETQQILQSFPPLYERAFARALARKLGLLTTQENDAPLVTGLYELLQSSRPDFTLFFRRLADVSSSDARQDGPVLDLCVDRAHATAWLDTYRARLGQEARDDGLRRVEMRAVNPKYVLRNYLAEAAIRRARTGDFSEIARLQRVLEHPFEEQPDNEAYAALPPDWAASLEVSCSS